MGNFPWPLAKLLQSQLLLHEIYFNVEQLPYGNQGLMIRWKSDFTVFHMVYTLDAKFFSKGLV